MPQFIESRGIRVAFEVHGEGPPLLMLHGAEGSRKQFAAIVPKLSDRYTVITYDQRDCGDTTGAEAPATLVELADDARALLEALGHRAAHVFGTSFGGRIAQALAVRHAPLLQHLVLAHTWPLRVSIAEANAEVSREIGRLRVRLPDTAEQLAELFYPPAFLVAHPAFSNHFKGAQPRSARTERRAAAVDDMPDLDIAGIDAPTLLIAGAMDRVVPATLTMSMAQTIPGARLVVLPDVGHLSLAQVPGTVAQHLREFLA